MFKHQIIAFVAVLILASLVLATSSKPREEVNYVEKKVKVAAFNNEKVIQADFFIRAEEDSSILIQMRNKRKASTNKYSPDNVVLFVHGATYPSETSYDLVVGGMSWMDFMAMQGYDAYFVNVRGYGDSTRPADTGKPIVRTVTAAADYATAVKYILRRRNISKMNVMGWSWGTSITTTFATNYPELVNRLVIYAPQWYRNFQSKVSGSYRNTTIEGRRASWLTGVAADKQNSIIPAGWFEIWESVTFAKALVNENGVKYLSTPTGIVYDNNEYWFNSINIYNSTKLNMPVLVIRAEWDADLNIDMSLGYFKNLTQVPYKKFVQIPEGTHQVLLEKNRMALFREVQHFLTEEKTIPLQATDYDLEAIRN